MTTKVKNTDGELLRRYTNQPERMPDEVRKQVEAAWQDGPVRYYGLADLDAELNLSQTWVALGDKHIAVVAPGEMIDLVGPSGGGICVSRQAAFVDGDGV